MPEEIKIIINEKGDVSFEVHGVKGQGCQKLTEALEKEIGSVQKRVHKQEWYQREANRLQQRS